MIERLTQKESAGYELKALNGEWCNHYCHKQDVHTCVDCGIYQAIQKLAHYEDMEEQLEKVYGECEGLLETAIKHISDIEKCGVDIGNPLKSRLLTDDDADKWEIWKNAEEQEKLLILPCKPGDTVYICKSIVSFGEIGNKSKVIYRVDKERFDYWMIPCIGKTVFLTEQEAKEALEGIQHEKA